MKKILFILVVAFSLTAVAQEQITEGVVSSKMVISSSDPNMQAQFAGIGDINSTTYFKNNKTRTETNNPMTGQSINIIDSDTKKMLVMMNNTMAGTKQYVEKTIEPTKEELEKMTISKGDETKTILGYVCQEYNIVMNNAGAKLKMDVYSTEQIKAVNEQTTSFGKDYKGYPLYMKMTINQMGMEIVMVNEAKEVKKESVSDDKFDMTPPEDYKKVDKIPGI